MSQVKTTAIALRLFVSFISAQFAYSQAAEPANRVARPGTSSTREHPAVTQPTTPPADVRQSTTALMHRNGGSLLRATLTASPDAHRATLAQVSPFAVPEPQPKTIKKHDLVTIIVREESENTHEGKSDLQKSADLEMAVEEWIKLSLGNVEIKGGAQGPTPPRIRLSGSRNFNGDATVERTDSVIGRITAEVVDVKPNGTLVLQARKRIKTDDEDQTITCAGICRVEDITADNSILSTQLFDMEFTKLNKGEVRNTTKKGWVPKLLDFINPF
jgi:flagellar L-ring protein precursor FlgH